MSTTTTGLGAGLVLGFGLVVVLARGFVVASDRDWETNLQR